MHLPEAAPAVLVMILFPLLRSEGRPLLNWKEALTEAINWDVIFLLGGGLALGLGLNKSGFSLWIGTIFRQLAGGSPSEWTVYALSTVLAFLLSYPASNTAAASVACPLAASIAQSVGVNPIPAILGAAIASSVSSSLPSTTPPMAIVYSSGYIRMRDMFKVGIVCDLLRLLAILAFGYPLSKYLLTLKGIG